MPRSSSFDRPKNQSAQFKKRNPKKKLNVKQSTLAQHFSLKSKLTNQESNVTDTAIIETKARLIKRNDSK